MGTSHTLTPSQFRAQLRRLDWSPGEAAKILHVNRRTVGRWLAGDRAIPGPVMAVLECHMAILDYKIEHDLRS